MSRPGTGPPDWLRPISEQFLDRDPGRPPRTVWLATALCAVCALLAAGMAATWLGLTARFVRDPAGAVPSLNIGIAAGLAAAGTILCVIFALGAVLLVRRGRVRTLTPAGATLGGLAVVGMCTVAGPARPLYTGDARPDLEWDVTVAVLPWLVAAAVAGFGLVLVLRTGSAGDWLAIRRHLVRAGGPARTRGQLVDGSGSGSRPG